MQHSPSVVAAWILLALAPAAHAGSAEEPEITDSAGDSAAPTGTPTWT